MRKIIDNNYKTIYRAFKIIYYYILGRVLIIYYTLAIAT